MLLFPTLGLAAAPVNSWAARRAALPAWLRDRRTTEYRRDRRAFAAGVATGGAVAVLGVAIAAIALLFTGHAPEQTPNLVGPARGSNSAPASPSRSPSASPSATTTPTTSPTTSTPTPSTSPSSSATPSASTTPSPSGSSTAP
jgi:cytoskeletal protein RodZ